MESVHFYSDPLNQLVFKVDDGSTIIGLHRTLTINDAPTWSAAQHNELIETTAFSDNERRFAPGVGAVRCAYCGNRSTDRDRRGNCLGCGAPR